MSSVDKLVLVNQTVNADVTIKQAESLGRIDHVAYLSVKNAAALSSSIKIQHSPNSSKELVGDWIDLHDFGVVSADGIVIAEITARVLPSVRAVISGVSGSAEIEVSILADRRGK